MIYHFLEILRRQHFLSSRAIYQSVCEFYDHCQVLEPETSCLQTKMIQTEMNEKDNQFLGGGLTNIIMTHVVH